VTPNTTFNDRPWYGELLDTLVRSNEPASRTYRYMARLLEREFGADSAGRALALLEVDDERSAVESTLMLAHSLHAELDVEVLLVDTRLKQKGRGLSAQLGLLGSPGFAELISGAATSIAKCVVPTRLPGVYLLPCGVAPPSGMQDRRALLSLVSEARGRFRWVLLQVGSVLSDTRYLLTAMQADAVFAVATEQKTRMTDLERCDELLRDNGVGGLRVVLVGERR